MTTTATNNIYHYTALHNDAQQTQTQTQSPAQAKSLRQRKPAYVADTDAASPYDNTRTTSSSAAVTTQSSYHATDTTMLFAALSIPLVITIFVSWGSNSNSDIQIMQTMLSIVVLILYCVDLWGPKLRDTSQLIIWVGLFVMPSFMSLIHHFILSGDDNNNNSGGFTSIFAALTHCGVEILIWLCLTSFLVLQFETNTINDPMKETNDDDGDDPMDIDVDPNTFTSLLFLYTLLPSTAAGLISWYFTHWSNYNYNYIPHVYWIAVALYHSVLNGPLCASYRNNLVAQWNCICCIHDNARKNKHNSNIRVQISALQIALLVAVPGCMQFLMILRGNHYWTEIDIYDVYDWLLTCTAPVCALELLISYQTVWWWNSASTLSGYNNNGHFKFLSRACRAMCFLVLQQRYWTPLCLDAQFYLLGPTGMASSFAVTCYLTGGDLLCAATYFVLYDGTMQELLGEYREDLAMTVLAGGAFLFCLAFGLPWTISPTFILCSMSMALFCISKQVRYLLIFLLVVALSLSAMIMFRVSFLRTIQVGGISLLWFGYLSVFALVLIGSAVGFTFRATDGIGHRMNVDSVGLLLLVPYALLLCFLETALVATRGSSEHESSSALYYPFPFCVGTSALLCLICRNLWKQKKISAIGMVSVISIAVGKLCCYLDCYYYDDPSSEYGAVVRAFAASMLVFILVSPYAILNPVQDVVVKNHYRGGSSSRGYMSYSRNIGGNGNGDAESLSFLKLYMVALPLVILLSSTIVIQPLLQNAHSILFANNVRTICKVEIIGVCSFLWGLETVSVVNYALPQSNQFGVVLKKVAVVALLLGLGLIFGGSSMQLFEDSRTQSLLMTSASTAVRRRSRLGASWGAMCAVASCLLALSGALDFRPSGRGKSTSNKSKAAIFCMLFGFGVVWFVTRSIIANNNTIGHISFMMLFVMTVCGTFCAIHHHYCDVNGIRIVSAVLPWSIVFLLVFIIVSIRSSFDKGMSIIFLTLCALTLWMWSVALKYRKVKNSTTISLGNALCLTSWLLAVAGVHYRFGLSNVNSVGGSNGIMGLPFSVIGTFLASFIVLCLEQPRDGMAHSRYPMHASPRFSIGSSPIKIAFAATSTVLFCASFYAIVLRGCGIFLLGVHKSHEDVFESFYGEGSRSSASLDGGNSPGMLKALIHNKVVGASAQLASAGFCTSTHWGGPTLHILGLLALCPNLYSFFKFAFMPAITTHKWDHVAFALPLTLFTLVACRAVTSLSVLVLLTLGGGCYQIFSLNRAQRSRKMRI